MDYRTGILLTRAMAAGGAAYLDVAERAPDFEADAFAEFARTQRMREWFTPLVDEAAARTRLPALVAELEKVRAAQRERAGAQLALCQEIRAGFAGAGVPCLFLKGLYIAERFYGDRLLRRQHDVDVLVRPQDCEAAVVALGALGFDTGAENARIRLEEIRALAPKRAPGTINVLRPDGMKIDLHIRTKSRWFHGVDETAYWPRRQTLRVAGQEFETLSDEHALVLALVSLCADLRRGAARGRHFLDLYLMLRAFDPEWDWQGFLARRRRESLLKTSVNALALLLTLWRCDDELPRLARALERHRARIEIRDFNGAHELVTRPRRSPENLVWYRRLGSRSKLAYLRWSLFQDLPHTLARGMSPLRSSGAGVPWGSQPPPSGSRPA